MSEHKLKQLIPEMQTYGYAKLNNCKIVECEK